MLQKTMKSVLSNKIKNWTESIEDKEVIKAIERSVIITGGAIVSLVNSETPNDFDVYFNNLADLLTVANYYASLFNKQKPHTKCVIMYDKDIERVEAFIKSTGVEYVPTEKDKKYQPTYITSNAITLTDDIQIILRFHGNPEEIHKNYDFLHCTGYYKHSDRELVIPSEVYDAILNKTLIYRGSLYPICSIIRIRKFLERGYKINAGQILKMAYQISKLDLDDIDILKDQLVGVDSAYFEEVIKRLQEWKDQGKEIDQTAIVQIIDEVF